MQKNLQGPQRPVRLIIVMAIAMALVLAAGAWFYQDQERQARTAAEEGLTAIGQLKANQIAEWRHERLANGNDLSGSSFFGQAVSRWLQEPELSDEAVVLRRFRGLAENYQYSNIILVDVDGRPRLSLLPTDSVFVQSLWPLVQRSLRSGRATLSDLLPLTRSVGARVCVVAPVVPWINGEPGQALGAVVLVADAEQFLYPLVESWPLPDVSAETLLVRRDGSDVLFLNNLRYQPSTALRLRIPLTNTDTPAVMAVLGKTGVFAGTDYRGVPVFSYLAPVPDSPWFIVAKEDEAAVLGAWRSRSVFIGGAILGLLAFCAVVTAGVWQRARSQQYQAAYAAQVERQALLRHFEYLVKYANDIILLADGQGRLVEANDRAAAAYGYSRQELLTLSLVDLEAPGGKPHPAADGTEGAVYESVHRRKDGAALPVEVSARDILVEGQRYRQAIVRDITERKAAEQALRASEAWLSATLRSIGDAVLTTDAAGRVTSLNVVAERLTGWSTAEVAGQPVEEVFHIINAQTRLPVSGPVERVLREGVIVGLANHTALISRSGEEYQIADSGAPIRSADDQIIGAVLVFRDVTEEYRVQAALQESEERLSATLRSIGDAVISTDADGRVTLLNTVAERLTGWTVAEARGRPVEEIFRIINADTREPVASPVRRVLQDGITVDLANHTALLSRTDQEYQIADSGAPIRSAEGEIMGVVLVFRDVTEQHRVQEELRRSERLLADAEALAHLGSYWRDAEDDQMHCSKEMLRLLGLDPEAPVVPAQLLYDRNHPDDLPRVHEIMLRSIEERRPVECEHRLLLPDGTERHVLRRLAPIFDKSGKHLRNMGMIQDTTERVHAEEQVAASLKEKEILLREIHHRVKNNLQVISSMLNMQVQTSGNPEIVEQLRDSQNRIKAMSLIHAKLYQSPELSRVEFGSFVRELGSTLLRSYGANSGRIRLTVTADELNLDLDTVMPCSLIVNELLANCVRHAFPDGRRGAIAVNVASQDGRCRLSVADDGVGLPSGLDYRDSPSLGLRLVSMLTEQLDGTLSMESSGGTRFTVEFALRARGQSAVAS